MRQAVSDYEKEEDVIVKQDKPLLTEADFKEINDTFNAVSKLFQSKFVLWGQGSSLGLLGEEDLALLSTISIVFLIWQT